MQSKLAEAEGFASSGYNERKRQTDRHNHRQTDRQRERATAFTPAQAEALRAKDIAQGSLFSICNGFGANRFQRVRSCRHRTSFAPCFSTVHQAEAR